ncbi:MAG: glycosyltransferase [Clostridiales bacterium]|nr:glycosyltransferase [Clostridiales bacterium]
MNILHYSLGFPPYRSGGLVKYCTDLMIVQREQGHNVSLLWPGEMIPWAKQKIKKQLDYEGVHSYEIINPLPVALDEGIQNPSIYMQKGNEEIYEQFFQDVRPDVLHIHTLMGLHREVLSAAKKSGIRTVFTTHDYYGICPKVTLFRAGHTCDEDHDCWDCVACNQSGLSITKIAIMQSAAYRAMNNSAVIKAIRKRHRTQFFDETIEEKASERILLEQADQYRRLRTFYLDMLLDIDIIHFNSTVTRDVYLRYFTPQKYKVIPITHRDIADHRKIKNFDHKKLCITYLGPAKPFKGYNLLKGTLDKLWRSGKTDFELRIYNIVSNPSPYMIMQDGYEYAELEEIFDNTDILVAPSVWCETFGFTVLEALSYAVPVIVSENVGAKDVFPTKMPVIHSNNGQDFLDAVNEMFDRERLKIINRNICEKMIFPCMNDVMGIYEENIE